jgi:hypothetical protein
MRRKYPHTIFCLPLLILLSSIPSFAARPVRGSSGNGTNPDAAKWNLLGRSQTISLAKNGKRVAMRRQIACLNEDVEDSLPSPDLLLTGTCHSKVYLHIFQFESNSTDVTVTIGGFITDHESPQNYGVMICNDSNQQTGNTLEVCTNDPTGTNLPDITISLAKNAANFAIPNFPSYPKGVDNQGRGLTLYVIVLQPSALPIQLPTVAIH